MISAWKCSHKSDELIVSKNIYKKDPTDKDNKEVALEDDDIPVTTIEEIEKQNNSDESKFLYTLFH